MYPTQIWKSDPSRGYTWLALSNDSTCSHQLDTHSAGQHQNGGILGMSGGCHGIWGSQHILPWSWVSKHAIVSDMKSGLKSNDWYDKCRQMLKSVATKWLSSWWHEMSSVKAC